MKQKSRKERRMEMSRMRRALAVGIIFCLALSGLLFRIWLYQDVYGDEYTQRVVTQAARRQIGMVSREIAPSRGRILDRNMQPIASSQQVFTVFLDVIALHERHLLRSTPERDILDEVLTGITVALAQPRHILDSLFALDITFNLANPTHHHILAREVPPEVAVPLAAMFPEVHATEESMRWIHDPFFAPQVIGFMRGDADGIWGLEAFYNRQLSGETGRTFWVQGEVEEVPVRDGLTLITTLDGDLQRIAQQYVDMALINHPAEFIGLIVMDPNTGEILAMAQAPTFSLADPFNPDLTTDGWLQENWDSLSDQQRVNEMMRMWRNFHTTRSFEPGSIFKPFVVAAAYEEGLISLDSTFFCEGTREIVDRYVRCWNWHPGCGGQTLRRALYASCNLAMADINRMLGRDLFYRYRGYFGFGERTGIDLPGEADVGSRAVMYRWQDLHAVELATSAMGQGFNASAIQAINGYAALINGGYVLQPFIVSQVVDGFGNVVYENTRNVIRRAISHSTSDFIRREMEHAITGPEGVATGWRLRIPGYAIGGKTGTAQQGLDREGRTLNLVAYTPIENPRYLVMMVIDDKYETGTHITAGGIIAPILRNFFLDLIRLRGLQPVDATMAIEDWEVEVMGTPLMPDFSGIPLADAVNNINNISDVGYHIIGSGITISHHIPAPGQPMPVNQPIFFHMEPESRIEGLMGFVPDVEGLTEFQANHFIREAGFIPIFHSGARPAVSGEFFPHTANAIRIGESDTEEPPQPPQRIVARQFPSPGTEIPLGIQVMMRVQ